MAIPFENLIRMGIFYGIGGYVGYEESLMEDIQIYPNPTREKLQITSTRHQTNSKKQAQNFFIEIVDLYSKVLESHNNGTMEQWNLTSATFLQGYIL